MPFWTTQDIQCFQDVQVKQHERLIDVTWGQGLMDEISYMRGTFSDQSQESFAKIQEEWNEEEKKLAEEHPR